MDGSEGMETTVEDGAGKSQQSVVDVAVSSSGSETGHKVELIQKFQAWRRKIKPLFEVLSKAPVSKLEIAICSSETENVDENETANLELLKTNDVISQCEALYENLLGDVESKRQEARVKWIQLQTMWQELTDKEEVQLGFTYAEVGVISAIDSLTYQLEMRQKEKSLRLEEFIKELRKEISFIWEQCMITDEEKSEFKEYYIDDFSEPMLDIHTNELKKWQIYHKKNQEILVKIQKREEMWAKLKELDARAEDPHRFVNRGGALLKDQTLHNQITKNLPKLEAELIKLADKFEKEHGRKMTILGKQIPVMIEEEWRRFKADKAERKQLRINQESNSTPQNISVIGNKKVPLMNAKSRISILPGSTTRQPEKRPAPKIPLNRSPVKKCAKLSSLESIASDQSEKN